MEHKLENLYSVFLALWEFTDPATMTKSYKPLFLEYHCFWLCCDRVGLQKPLLSSQLSGSVIIIQMLVSQGKSTHRRLQLLFFPHPSPLYSEYK